MSTQPCIIGGLYARDLGMTAKYTPFRVHFELLGARISLEGGEM